MKKKAAAKPRRRAVKSVKSNGVPPTHGLDWLEGHLNKSGRTLKKKKG